MDIKLFCEILEDYGEISISETPDFITLVAIRDELSGKIPVDIISKFLGKVKINVDHSFVSNKESFNRAIKLYSKCILNSYNAYSEEFNDDNVFLNNYEKYNIYISSV